MNNKTVSLVLVSLGLLLVALATRSSDLAWMALPFLLYLGIGLYRAPVAERLKFKAARTASRGSFEGTPTIEVRITVRNEGVPVDRLYLSDALPAGTTLLDGEASRWTALRPGEEVELRYVFPEKRGSYTWDTVKVVASDPFGLVETGLVLPARAEIQIQPERGQFRRLNFRPRSTLHSPGSIPAHLGGSGTDFWGVREYHPGDSLRWLDWRLTARHPHQFFTKEFEQEEIADIGLILDGRKRTDMHVSGDSLFEHSVQAAAALAEVFLHQGHRVSLLVFSGHLTEVFPGYGKVQLNRIMRCLAKAQPGSNGLIKNLQFVPLKMFSSHALLVVISPLTTSDWPFFPRLRASGYQGLLISPNPFDFAATTFDQDPATKLAVRAAQLERSILMRNITQLQIPIVDWAVHQPLYPLVRTAFGSTRGVRER